MKEKIVLERTNFQILIVDDIPKNIQIVANILKRDNYNLFFASNGSSALEQIALNDFDLILLDIMMPDIDGFEVCKQVRNNSQTKDIPIIFLTAKTEAESIVKGFELGGQDYVTKPFNSMELLARVQTHLMLRKSQKQLKRSNKDLEQFAYIVSHDLKNPLNTMLGFLQLIQMDIENEEYSKLKEYIVLAFEKGKYMNNLIDDLLEFSRLQRSKISLEFIDLNEVVFRATGLLREIIKEKDAQINYNELPTIKSDRMQMTQLFQNLIGNAIKYCDKKPEITINATQDNQFHLISIKDNGIGIAENKLENIFEVFQRVDHKNKEYEGTGIGLAICKKIVERHHGKIWASSDEGNGSTFWFTLPL